MVGGVDKRRGDPAYNLSFSNCCIIHKQPVDSAFAGEEKGSLGIGSRVLAIDLTNFLSS